MASVIVVVGGGESGEGRSATVSGAGVHDEWWLRVVVVVRSGGGYERWEESNNEH
jgi:hypothetical protein